MIKKLRLFGALPPQNWYILAPKAPLENFLGFVTKNGYFKIVQRGREKGVTHKSAHVRNPNQRV